MLKKDIKQNAHDNRKNCTDSTSGQKEDSFNAFRGLAPMTGKGMILSEHISVSRDTGQTHINENVICFGGPGTGKTNNIIRPNIEASETSFIVTDPAGELIHSYGKDLAEKGYTVKVFNTSGTAPGSHYNPLAYIKDAYDAEMMARAMIRGTGSSACPGDLFWERGQILLIEALILGIKDLFPRDKQNLSGIYDMLRMSSMSENCYSDGDETDLDRLFCSLRKDSSNTAVKLYDTAKQASAQTFSNMISDLLIRLKDLNLPEMQNLTSEDRMNLGTIGDRKTAIFLTYQTQTDRTLAGILLSQAARALTRNCESRDGRPSSLKEHVVFYLDDIASVCPEGFDRFLATARKYNMSAVITADSVSQLRKIYGADTDSIIGCCDTKVFMGLSDNDTINIFAKDQSCLGRHYNNMSHDHRPTVSSEELKDLACNKCVVIIRGFDPAIDIKTSPKKLLLDRACAAAKETVDNMDDHVSSRPSETYSRIAEKIHDKEKVDIPDDSLQKAGSKPGDLTASVKAYTVNEAEKIINIKLERIEKYKEQLDKTCFTYMPYDAGVSAENACSTSNIRNDRTNRLLSDIDKEYRAIADIRGQIDEFDRTTIPEEMNIWSMTIAQIKQELPGLMEQKKILTGLASRVPEEMVFDKENGKMFVKRAAYDISRINTKLYGLVFKIAYWQECIEEAYTSQEVIKIKDELWI